MSVRSFSIITVCLNEEAAIRETCESIVSQKYQNFEWIVIDGASTDGTLKILNEYGGAIHHLVSEPDAGIYNAMNKGAAIASGDYLIFMNGGDRFASSDVLDAVAQCPDTDLIVGELEFADDGVVRTFPSQLNSGYLLRNMLPHQATFFHRSIFERFGYFDESFKIAGDYEFFVRIIKENKVSYHHIPKVLAVFLVGGMSSSSHQRTLRKRENHRVRSKHFIRYRYSLKAWRQQFREFFN
jgi:glycosyltransferase involved in cell wall biosynthesis